MLSKSINSYEPLVSVLMTAYNRSRYIEESIKSVLNSTYSNFELIIVDDCSEDATVSIARKFEAIDKRVKVYINETNLGDYINRNMAASYASGKYIKYLDSDDLIYPWGLHAMVYCMEMYPEAGYGLMSYRMNTSHQLPLLLSPARAYYAFYFNGSFIIAGPSGSIIRRDIFTKEGGFSGKRFLGDTELWLKLSSKYGLVAMPLDLVWWRQHEEQQIKDEKRDKNIEKERFMLYVNSLTSEHCPFSTLYKTRALRNLKNRYARKILKNALVGKIRKSFFLYNLFDLKFTDLISSSLPNRYPPVI